MKRVIENLEGTNKKYLFPFFWQHGETNETIAIYMDKMWEQGIHNICIESRPHPDFLGNDWWRTVDFIIVKAKEKDMKVWILDDAKFPTGYANGKVPEDLKKRYLACRRFDIVGPNQYAKINLTQLAGTREIMKDKRHLEDSFFKAILVENNTSTAEAFNEGSRIDVSHCYHDGFLHLTLEDKHYSLFVLYQTVCNGEEATKDYLDPMRREATQILIDEVYEKHYQQYQDEFGKTIVAFFSDEPRFGNIKGTTASIGREKMVLPWNEEVYEMLHRAWDDDTTKLVFLFQGQSNCAHQARFVYMDIVSQLYSDNFSSLIGEWCKQRGVDYVGHTIEDNNAHARLGYGAGHFFRGIAGQTIAGIDIIGGQVVPGMDYHHDAFSTGGSDGEFYHYALVNMGASAAKLDTNKNGILMCEAFGAYGWIEGLKMMKWITDHMISHGVNLIVPHAFNPAKFPDWDCPPHFYAHGNNHQYPYFHKWSNYADRLCHIMSGGHQVAKVGVLYHAFAEWSGDYMLVQKLLKELQQNQISCNTISEDYIISSIIKEQSYQINGYDFEVLVIPYAQNLPQSLLQVITQLSKVVQVIFIDSFPDNALSNDGDVIALQELADKLSTYKTITTSSKEEYLVCYHYRQDDGDIYMLSNEDIHNTIDTTVILKEKQEFMVYDAYQNQTYALPSILMDEGRTFTLSLAPYESLVLVIGQCENVQVKKGTNLLHEIREAKISFRAFNQEAYSKPKQYSLTHYLGETYSCFSGNIKYEFDVTLEETEVILDIGNASEIVEVIVNDKSVQTYIAPPYQFDIEKQLKSGLNHIEVIVTNTLSRYLRDGFSMYIALEPLGIINTIKLYNKERVT